METSSPLLISQFYEPDEHDVLYHYCPMSAFESILRTGTLRFSDINLLNDAAEMRWGYSIFIEAANRMIDKPQGVYRNLVDRELIDVLDSVISGMEFHAHLITASFSRHSDDLSQWRSYAQNGSGVAIGFRGMTLGRMATTMLSCIYEPEEQIEAIANQLRAIALIADGKRDIETYDQLRFDAQMIASYLPAIKHPTFQSEAEVRGVHMLTARIENGGKVYRLLDEGGSDESGETPPLPVQYRIRDELIVPFVDIPFCVDERIGKIQSVVLGPRNPNAVGNVMAILSAYGFDDTDVIRSDSTYRG